MTQLTFQHLNEAIDKYDLFLFDLWGVVIEGEETYPGVVEALNRLISKKDVMFLSNAPRPDFKVAENLRKWGVLDVTAEMVLTSGDISRQMIAAKAKALDKKPTIYHLGADRNEDILLNCEHEITEDISVADILLLSLYRDEHEDLNEFNQLLEQAAQRPELLTLCSNPDTTIPKHGILRYCAGYFAEIMEKAGGKVVYTGKPKTIIYEEIFKRRPSIAKNKILMIGDTFETDVLGANSSGIHSALVLTGNSAPFHREFDSMEDKLAALSMRAKAINITAPTFVTQIV